jgi:hypothetical protein
MSRALRRGACLTAGVVLLSAGPAHGAISFGPPLGPFPQGVLTANMVTADFNRDGRPDLALNAPGSSKVAILLGDGEGRFTSAAGSPAPAGSTPVDLVAGDFNGDTKPDLALANYSTTVSILLGDGGGGFTTKPDITVPTGPYSIATGDLNDDGHLDLVTASNGASNGVDVRLGDGTGAFPRAAGAPYAPFSTFVAIGDFNVDGKPDIVAVPSSADAPLVILLGNGNGGFNPSSASPVAVTHDSAPTVAIGDLNGDGKPDLAITNATTDQVNVLLGNGSGGFAPSAGSPLTVGDAPYVVVTADFNADHHLDLAVTDNGSGDVSVLAGDGAGGFAAPHAFGDLSGVGALAAADLNGDDSPDLAVSGFPAPVSLLNTSPAGHAVAGGPLGFGTQAAGSLSAPKSISISSSGEATLRISRVRVTGADDADFIVAGDDCTGAALPVGSSCTVKVRFGPSAESARSATLEVTWGAGSRRTAGSRRAGRPRRCGRRGRRHRAPRRAWRPRPGRAGIERHLHRQEGQGGQACEGDLQGHDKARHDRPADAPGSHSRRQARPPGNPAGGLPSARRPLGSLPPSPRSVRRLRPCVACAASDAREIRSRHRMAISASRSQS